MKKEKKQKNQFNFYWIYAIVAVFFIALQIFSFASNPLKKINKKEFFTNFLIEGDVEKLTIVNNEFVEVDPRSWNADADMIVNVGIGTGREAEKSAVLRETLQMQMSVWHSKINGKLNFAS